MLYKIKKLLMKKIVTLLSLLLRVLAVLAAAVAIYGWVTTKGKIAEANQQVQQAKAEAVTARADAAEAMQKFKSTNTRASALDSDLADAKSRATSARSQLAQAQREISELKQQIQTGQSEIRALESQNTKLKEEIIAAKTEVPTTLSPEDTSEQQRQMDELRKEITNLRGQLSRAQTSAAATVAGAPGLMDAPLPSESTPEGQATEAIAGSTTPRLSASGETAEILKADTKNGLVIISSGYNQGLQADMELGIAVGTSAPVRIRVSKIETDYSIANILPGEGPRPRFAEGDVITLLQ